MVLTEDPRTKAMAPITIYTTGWCPYCSAAKDLLRQKGVDFTEVDVEKTPAARAEMVGKAGGRSTVPQIFIGSRHVGGCDDLYALEERGELDVLLRA
jgi:glutaredoxin 3